MLDEGRMLDPGDGDFVQFLRAGTDAQGDFYCSGCGYGITVQAALPQCPMCAGTTWEAAGGAPHARPGPLQ